MKPQLSISSPNNSSPYALSYGEPPKPIGTLAPLSLVQKSLENTPPRSAESSIAGKKSMVARPLNLKPENNDPPRDDFKEGCPECWETIEKKRENSEPAFPPFNWEKNLLSDLPVGLPKDLPVQNGDIVYRTTSVNIISKIVSEPLKTSVSNEPNSDVDSIEAQDPNESNSDTDSSELKEISSQSDDCLFIFDKPDSPAPFSNKKPTNQCQMSPFTLNSPALKEDDPLNYI